MTGSTHTSGGVRSVKRRARAKRAPQALDLARAAAHDLATFRTILDLQSEGLAALLAGQEVPPIILEKLRRIVRTSRAVSETAASFIQLAREADAAKRPRSNGRRRATLQSIIGEVEARFSSRARERGVRLTFTPTPDVALRGDANVVRWALLTLVETALELTEHPELEVSCAVESPSMLSVCVREAGALPAQADAIGFSMGLGLLREALRASGGSLETSHGPTGGAAALRLSLDERPEPHRLLLLSCDRRGRPRAGWLLRTWDASWVTAMGMDTRNLLKATAPEGALVLAGRSCLPAKAVAWLKEAARECPIAVVAGKPAPPELLRREIPNVRFIPAENGAIDKALEFLSRPSLPDGRRRGPPSPATPRAGAPGDGP